MKRPSLVSYMIGAIALVIAVAGLSLSSATADPNSTGSTTDPVNKTGGQGIVSSKIGF